MSFVNDQAHDLRHVEQVGLDVGLESLGCHKEDSTCFVQFSSLSLVLVAIKLNDIFQRYVSDCTCKTLSLLRYQWFRWGYEEYNSIFEPSPIVKNDCGRNEGLS